jgi:hypothetical protein
VLSVVSLRIEIEQALRQCLERRAIPLPDQPSIASMVGILENVGLLPTTKSFADALKVMKSATHRRNLNAAAVADAFAMGKDCWRKFKWCFGRSSEADYLIVSFLV